jgi:hypothetical protein
MRTKVKTKDSKIKRTKRLEMKEWGEKKKRNCR